MYLPFTVTGLLSPDMQSKQTLSGEYKRTCILLNCLLCTSVHSCVEYNLFETGLINRIFTHLESDFFPQFPNQNSWKNTLNQFRVLTDHRKPFRTAVKGCKDTQKTIVGCWISSPNTRSQKLKAQSFYNDGDEFPLAKTVAVCYTRYEAVCIYTGWKRN